MSPQLISGPQYGVKYTLTAADGARAVFNDDTDADYVGVLSSITGLDSPDVRDSSSLRVEDDGGVHGNFWLDRRPVVLGGMIRHTSTTDRNLKMTKLQRASMSLRSDAQLDWTPDGGVAQFIKVRRQQPLRIEGGWNKTFLCAMVSADPRIYSSTIIDIVAEAIAGSSSGTGFPMTFDFTFLTAGAYAQILAENQGNYESPPTLIVEGPITNPNIRNETAGKNILLNYTLAAGETLTIDTLNHTVIYTPVAGAQSSRYSAVDFTATDWWRLSPGVNDIRLSAYSADAGAQLTVQWRHSWA